MRKLLVFSAFLIGFSPAASFAQAVSGGQAPQAGTEVRANPYNSNNAVDQYLQQKQINNLPDQKRQNTNVASLGPARPAKTSELTAGAIVNDNSGEAMAKIEQVDADGVVVSLGAAKVKIPADAFGHNKAGLLLDMTKAQFEQIVARANAAS
jgi:hypothetical protein